MNRSFFLIILVFPLFLGFELKAAAPDSLNLDSLKQVASVHPVDSVRFDALERLCKNYRSVSLDSAFHYARKMRSIGKRSREAIYTAKGYNQVGILHLLSGNLDSALSYFREADSSAKYIEARMPRLSMRTKVVGNIGILFRNAGKSDSGAKRLEKALSLAKENNDSLNIARQQINLATIYKQQSKFPKAKELLLDGTRIAEELGKPVFAAKANTNLGTVHQELKEYDKALKRYRRSIRKFKETGDKRSLGEVLLNVGLAYQKLDSLGNSLEANKKALSIAREGGYKRIEIRAGNNIAELYSRFYESHMDSLPVSVQGMLQKKGGDGKAFLLDTVETIYKRTLRASKENGFREDISYAHFGLGYVAMKRGHLQEALQRFEKSYEVIKGQGMKRHVYGIHHKLAQVNARMENHRAAYRHHKKYARLKDSVFNEKKSKELGRLDAKYAYEKKLLRQRKEAEKDRAMARAEQRRQRIVIFSMGGGLVLVLVFTGLLVSRYRLIRSQKRTIEEKKLEVDRAYEELSERDQEIRYSLDYAQSIQQAILPPRESFQELFPADTMLFFLPKEKVSGDFYWCNRAPNGRLVWVVGDCTGHGVPGAFMSMIGVRLFNEAVLEKGETDPGKILDHVRGGIIDALVSDREGEGKSDGMDAVVCSLDEKNGRLTFAGANNPLYLVREGSVEEVPEPDRSVEEGSQKLFEYKGDKMAVGAGSVDKPFRSKEIPLEEGDMLYVFSDGFADQFGGDKGKKYRYGPFKRLLCQLYPKDGTEQEKDVQRTFTDWKQGMEQVDDVCILGVRFRKR